jgi:hypothetical protein
MPYGQNLQKCSACGKVEIVGDCIESECKECQCKRLGHLWIGSVANGFCVRCGHNPNRIIESGNRNSNPLKGR